MAVRQPSISPLEVSSICNNVASGDKDNNVDAMLRWQATVTRPVPDL